MTGALVVFVTHDIEEAVYLSDRIVVLTGSPARVTHEFDVELPRPRDQISTRESEEYLRIRHNVHMALRGDHPGFGEPDTDSER
jgi:NitT/TauT family transport system ATP-binding protein